MLIPDLQAGRLLETRGTGVITYADFITFRSSFQELIAKALRVSGKALAVGDLRDAEELSPEVAPAVLGMLRADNARLERSAHLVTAGTAFHKQYLAIVGATRNANRQVFTDVPALLSWMEDLTTPAEQARLEQMLRS